MMNLGTAFSPSTEGPRILQGRGPTPQLGLNSPAGLTALNYPWSCQAPSFACWADLIVHLFVLSSHFKMPQSWDPAREADGGLFLLPLLLIYNFFRSSWARDASSFSAHSAPTGQRSVTFHGLASLLPGSWRAPVLRRSQRDALGDILMCRSSAQMAAPVGPC